jgi:hypothetical protein
MELQVSKYKVEKTAVLQKPVLLGEESNPRACVCVWGVTLVGGFSTMNFNCSMMVRRGLGGELRTSPRLTGEELTKWVKTKQAV